MGKYKHVFFDLDRTLWDFQTNSSSALSDIVEVFELKDKVTSVEDFVKSYNKHNDYVWDLYRKNEITKDVLRVERFRSVLEDFGIEDPELTEKVQVYYVENSPKKGHLLPGAMDLLEYLHGRYKMYIITNGFQHTQLEKAKWANIDGFFERIFTSDKIGAAKPSQKIFEHSLKSSNARKVETIVIGDDVINDISGAKSFGLDQLWYNPHQEKSSITPTYEVRHLSEIKNIL